MRHCQPKSKRPLLGIVRIRDYPNNFKDYLEKRIPERKTTKVFENKTNVKEFFFNELKHFSKM